MAVSCLSGWFPGELWLFTFFFVYAGILWWRELGRSCYPGIISAMFLQKNFFCTRKLWEKWWMPFCLCLEQGSPNPRPWAGTSWCPVRNRATQQEVRSGRVSEASSVFTAAPHHLHYHLSSASCQISGGIRFSQEREPYCELRMRGI